MKLLVLLMAVSTTLLADEIKVLSGGAARHALEPMVASFPAHKVTFDFQTMGRLQQSLAAGQKPDLLVVTTEVLERLEKDGKLPAGKGTPLARVGIGVAVHEKAPLPDISTPEAMRRTLLAARSIVYINPKTGRIVGTYNSDGWINRWLYHGLHSFDFPWLYNYRPLWDVVVITFMVGGTALCVTSLILAWRVIGRKLGGAIPGAAGSHSELSDDLAVEVD